MGQILPKYYYCPLPIYLPSVIHTDMYIFFCFFVILIMCPLKVHVPGQAHICICSLISTVHFSSLLWIADIARKELYLLYSCVSGNISTLQSSGHMFLY